MMSIPANPLWTDTGISLVCGDHVIITASGSWCWQDPTGCSGPEGGDGAHSDEFEHFDSTDHGRLEGYIGTDPYQGHWGDCPFWPRSGYLNVGADEDFVVHIGDNEGPLWLGINDDACSAFVDDNTGSQSVAITVNAGPCT